MVPFCAHGQETRAVIERQEAENKTTIDRTHIQVMSEERLAKRAWKQKKVTEGEEEDIIKMEGQR